MKAKKTESPQDNMTSPRYIDAQRKINEMKPLKERTANVNACLYHQDYLNTISWEKKKLLNCRADHITPHAKPLQGQGQISANFSASLE